MRDDQPTPSEPVDDELFLDDLVQSMATCVGIDPGPDPTWDPDDFPPDDEGIEGL